MPLYLEQSQLTVLSVSFYNGCGGWLVRLDHHKAENWDFVDLVREALAWQLVFDA